MAQADVRFRRLLDRGFYPQELPPSFTTQNFSLVASNTMVWPLKRLSYGGQLIHFDGATYQGNLRTFGIINPINYCILSRAISDNWGQISKCFSLSSCSGNRPIFPKSAKTGGRSIDGATLTRKRKFQKHLASAYPYVVDLDISRFYGTVYTHSITWAVLGKNKAKELYSAKQLSKEWSNELDTITRNCNSKQTVGLPIGPDTSRIISELILSRIDRMLVTSGAGIFFRQMYHNIDDYQIGVYDLNEADTVQSAFAKALRDFELRLNDFKVKVRSGMSFAPSNWQRELDLLRFYKDLPFIERFFDMVYDLMNKHPNSNIAGYSLKRFGAKLLNSHGQESLVEYLQRFLLASPFLARWILPLYLVSVKKIGVSQENRRVIDWCISNCIRRSDIGSLSWFLYLKIFLGIPLSVPLGRQCFELSCPITDLQLMHLKQVELCSLPASIFRNRYVKSSMSSADWLPIYEIERRGWDSDVAFKKIGTKHDITGSYASLADNDVEFYRTSDECFTAGAFTGWKLEEDKTLVEGKTYCEEFTDDVIYFHSPDADEEIYK